MNLNLTIADKRVVINYICHNLYFVGLDDWPFYTNLNMTHTEGYQLETDFSFVISVSNVI